jgi:hypothetical protein
MGFRVDGGCHVYWWEPNCPERPRPLSLRLDLFNHSPSGFSWGYGGSGPAQLALALAADALGDGPRAVAIHQRLKFSMIARLNKDCWTLTRDQVCTAIVRLESVRRMEREVNDDDRT